MPAVNLAVGETFILLPHPLPLKYVGVMQRRCQQNDRTIADGLGRTVLFGSTPQSCQLPSIEVRAYPFLATVLFC